jgi:hypothetical protein
MHETPDFTQIATTLAEKITNRSDVYVEREAIAYQLRLVWNARGAADAAAISTVRDRALLNYEAESLLLLDAVEDEIGKLVR